MANYSFLNKEFSIDVYIHIFFLFLRTDCLYIVRPEALVNTSILSNKHYINYLDSLSSNKINYKSKTKFHNQFEKLFENVEAYKAFLLIGSMVAFCLPSNENLKVRFNKCLARLALLCIGKHDIFNEEQSLVINFNNLEKDFNKYCLDCCIKMLEVIGLEKKLEQNVQNDEMDFENTLSMKASKKNTGNISKLFSEEKSLSRIYSINSNIEHTNITAFLKEEKVIVSMLKEIISTANEGECQIDTATDGILQNLFDMLEKKFNKNNSFSLENEEKLSEISIYSARSDDEATAVNMLDKKEMFTLLNKFVDNRKTDKIKVIKSNTITNSGFTELDQKPNSEKELRKFSLLSKKMSSIGGSSLKRDYSRGRIYSQNKTRNSGLTDLSSLGMKMGNASNQTKLAQSSSGSINKHANRIKQRTLSLFDVEK